MQEKLSNAAERSQAQHSRIKLAGAILGGLAIPIVALSPFMGPKVYNSCESGYTEPQSGHDNLFDTWARNLAVNFCDAKIPQPVPATPSNPFIMNA